MKAKRSRFTKFMSNFDATVHQEMQQFRGLSPAQAQARKEGLGARKEINNFMDTINSQNKRLPEWLKVSTN